MLANGLNSCWPAASMAQANGNMVNRSLSGESLLGGRENGKAAPVAGCGFKTMGAFGSASVALSLPSFTRENSRSATAPFQLESLGIGLFAPVRDHFRKGCLPIS
jgi:hypothetical protein